MIDSTTQHKAKVESLPAEELKAIETFYRAFEGKPELLDDAVAADWQDIPLAPGQIAGRDGMKPLIADFGAAFPDAKVTIHEIISAPGRAAVRAVISGTHEGEWFGIAPTGKTCQLAIHEFQREEKKKGKKKIKEKEKEKKKTNRKKKKKKKKKKN